MDHEAVRLAILGMRDALDRLATLTDNTPADLEGAGIFTVNATNWACALDELLREADPTYLSRRGADRDGQFLEGLRYVRDRHMHQLVVSNTQIWRVTAGFGLDGRRYDSPNQPGIAWKPVDDISEPADNRINKRSYQSRRSAYENLLQLRRVHLALVSALSWLTTEVMAHRVVLPAWQLPTFQMT